MTKLYKLIVLFLVITVAKQSAFAQLNSYFNAYTVGSSVKEFSLFSSLYSHRQEASSFSNYPNPATTRTTIAYTLSHKSNVNLRVIDLAGKQLAVLVKSNKAAGKHEFTWEFANNNISPGMYILVLQIDSKTYTRKVIVQ